MPSEERRPTGSQDRTWAVLIFMIVDDDSIEPFAVTDLRQLERVQGLSPDKVVVQLHWHRAPFHRYEVCEGRLRLVSSGSLDQPFGRAEALREFLAFASANYPATHYALMLWGHAYGFGFGRETGDRLSFGALAELLGEFADSRRGTKLEILAANACRFAKVEAVYELYSSVRYLVASQVGVPQRGWPILRILADLVACPTILPRDFANLMVSRYGEWYREDTLTMTLLDLDQCGGPIRRLTSLARSLLSAATLSEDEACRIHEAFVLAANEAELLEPIVDLSELCSRLLEVCTDDDVRACTSALQQSLEDSRIIVKHEAHGPSATRLHGLGICVPHVALDEALPISANLGVQETTLWTQAREALRSQRTLADLLVAMRQLEIATLHKTSSCDSTCTDSAATARHDNMD